jgi:hypothetical protein
MSAKKTLFDKLYEAGEEGLYRFAQEALSHPAVAAGLKKALRNVTATKGTIDKSFETLLATFNLPSKDDYNKLLTKVETLQGSLVNLNIKLDRLLATRAKQQKHTRKRTKPSSRSADTRRAGDRDS